LQAQLNDLEYLIQVREEELQTLRGSSHLIAEMRSQLETNALSQEQLQLLVSEFQQKYDAIRNREETMENELVDHIENEKNVDDWVKKNKSLQTELDIVLDELEQAKQEIQSLTLFKDQVVELQSKLEMLTYRLQPGTNQP
jgi:predicted  nucleic acid-binding Zn-ribbon protein